VIFLESIFSTITGQITGGLAPDLMTVVVGLLTLSVIVLGVSYIRNLMENSFAMQKFGTGSTYEEGGYTYEFDELDDLREQKEYWSGTAKGDFLSRKYNDRMESLHGGL